SVLYYARRRGTALPIPGTSWPGTIDAAMLHDLAATHALLAVTDGSADTSVLRESPWFSPVSAHVYRMAAQPEPLLARTKLAATSSLSEAAGLPDSPSATTSVPCNGVSTLVRPGVVIRFAPVTEADARVTIV